MPGPGNRRDSSAAFHAHLRPLAQFAGAANATNLHALCSFRAGDGSPDRERMSARNGLEQACVNGECTTGGAMPDEEPAEIELRRCLYPALCSVRACRVNAELVS